MLDSTKRALGLLKEKGHRIILATARSPVAMEPIWDHLGCELFYIGLNGALIVQGQSILWEEAIPPAGAAEALGLARRYGFSINVYAGRRWVIEQENPLSQVEAEIVGVQPEVAGFGSLEKLHKILVIGGDGAARQYQRELQARTCELNVSISKPTYCEIVSHRASKGRALRQACALLGVDLEDTVAFGDGENDGELFAVAGRTVAMGNGHPALRAAADFVTASNDGDGILKGVLWALGQA